MMQVSCDLTTNTIDVFYTPACDAVNHTIYIGDLARVSTYGYDAAVCNVGNSGSAGFNPAAGSRFFLVVGNNASEEGSYGRASNGSERTEDVGTPACDLPQDLGGTCDIGAGD